MFSKPTELAAIIAKAAEKKLRKPTLLHRTLPVRS